MGKLEILKAFAFAHAITVTTLMLSSNFVPLLVTIFWGIGVVISGLIEFRIRHRPGPPWQIRAMLVISGWGMPLLAVVGSIVYACKKTRINQ